MIKCKIKTVLSRKMFYHAVKAFQITLLLGGEELFGLSITEYPDLQQIKRELGLLQKLYSLYNSVIENVNGYYDIPWVEVDIEKINSELQDYQNRCMQYSIFLIQGVKNNATQRLLKILKN